MSDEEREMRRLEWQRKACPAEQACLVMLRQVLRSDMQPLDYVEKLVLEKLAGAEMWHYVLAGKLIWRQRNYDCFEAW